MPQVPSARILIADDSVSFRNVFILLLENAGYAMTGVSEGRQALEALRSQSFDLAILDSEMPNLDGLAVLAELRTFNADLPVIVCSGTGTSEQAARYQALGIADLLIKPVDPRPLLGKINRVLERRLHPGSATASLGKANPPLYPHLPSPLAAGPSKAAAKLNADLVRLREFRSIAILEGPPGSGRFELALSAPPALNSHTLACHADEFSAAWLDKVLGVAHRDQLPMVLVILDADRLSHPMQLLLESLVRGRLEKHADLSRRLRLILCAQESLCDLHFNEYLLMRAMANTYHIPAFSSRQEDRVEIAKAILHRASSGKEMFGSAALKWIELQPWPGNYMQLHRTIELARLQARLTPILSAMQLQSAIVSEPQCTEPLFHDLLFHVHSCAE